MISEAHQQKRFGREVVTETGEEGGIVALAQALPPQIFLDMGRVAEVAPIRRQIRPEAVVPRKMNGGEIGENKQRAAAALALDQPCGLVIEKEIRFDAARADVFAVEKLIDARGPLEAARTHERAPGRIECKSPVAAPAQRMRQSAGDAAGCDAGDGIGEAREGARGKAGEDAVFGKPSRTARAFDDK